MDEITINQTIFKQIKDFPDYYASKEGEIYSTKRNKILKQVTTKVGYKRVPLGTTKLHTVHRLVAQTFIPNPENKSDVNHKNGDKSDNRISNLEWMTKSENHKHAWKTGLKKINASHEGFPQKYRCHNI